ncbi:LLM class oxidoreductase [Pseudomonas syringae pv. tomato]|uniref:LLM class oxidoreductase n=6 Tax=Pseudomonas syringae group TaxID=136849 RepID=A0AAW4E6F1_PSESX|nr:MULTISPECIES: LLM class oxidoreductase [Pseudomonas syringae group]AVI84603.1 LLM class oxidoreductase [Pseudomonas syringae pv. tomato]EEB58952.1 bacterial luciferase family protein [Pseudomonas syringae pv. tomato T1]KGK93889.1 luciferase [Pseudomonas syringae pv. tomato]KPB79938.1 Bacterial luciferase family protein [Pseudomonas syringae pv. maculicola]KTC02526.1 luciferase [Pseudomonas syringae ICMP 11292]
MIQDKPLNLHKSGAHSAFSKVFAPGHLTFGLIAPLEGYPNSAVPTMDDHIALAVQADKAGFAALWLRDVPMLDPAFGDAGQIFDPFVYAGLLAGVTQRICIGTAGIVMTLRHPLTVAKQACSLDVLLKGRFLLGLSTGDRPSEYPAFGQDFDTRAERFRECVEILRAVTERSFPLLATQHYGQLNGELDLLPKPWSGRLPMLAVGRCGQDIKWLANHMDGWIWHQSGFNTLPEVIDHWRESNVQKRFKPYGYATFFDLDDNKDAPMTVGRGISTGRNALIRLWERQREQGVSHVALNLKPLKRPAKEVLQELEEYVLPYFPTRRGNPV